MRWIVDGMCMCMCGWMSGFMRYKKMDGEWGGEGGERQRQRETESLEFEGSRDKVRPGSILLRLVQDQISIRNYSISE